MKATENKVRDEQSWSLLDPRPVLLYLEHHDEYIVYWNGIVMPHTMALCMTMERFGIYATPEMKHVLLTTYRRLYYANAFKTRFWDPRITDGDVYGYLKNIMKDHLNKICEDKTPQDILSWFDYSRARQEQGKT